MNNKQRKVTGVYYEKRKDNQIVVGLIVNKEGKKDPNIITNDVDEALNKYMDLCNKYNIKVNIKAINNVTPIIKKTNGKKTE